MELEMISCTKCNSPMPKLRKEKYGYSFCVNCSTEKPLVARTVTFGTGDDIWTDTEIITQDQAQRILELEANALGRKVVGEIEVLDFDAEESPVSSSATPIIKRLIDDEELDDQSAFVYDADYDTGEEEEDDNDDIADD
jgi:hypothetical protein